MPRIAAVSHQGRAGGGDDQYVGKYESSNCKMWFTEVGQAYQQWDGGGYIITGTP